MRFLPLAVRQFVSNNMNSFRYYALSAASTSAESSPLLDNHGRFHDYLRISLTERCNLRCRYCMPADGVPLTSQSSLMNTDEIVRTAALFVRLGVRKIRLTGGEPTLRKDLLEITERLTGLDGLETLGLTTNGLVLHRTVDRLVDAGCTAINISLDTLEPAKFERLTRRRGHDRVMKSIDLSERALSGVVGGRLKVNCVVMRGSNDDELLDFVELTRDRNIDVRFIEFMPFGGNAFSQDAFMPYAEMLTSIEKKYSSIERELSDEDSTCKLFRVPGFRGRFGFISSMSDHFCSTCTRLRLTADGHLKVCLHGRDEVLLRDALRHPGMDDDSLCELIRYAVRRKRAKHAGLDVLARSADENRPMVLIGG